MIGIASAGALYRQVRCGLLQEVWQLRQNMKGDRRPSAGEPSDGRGGEPWVGAVSKAINDESSGGSVSTVWTRWWGIINMRHGRDGNVCLCVHNV